MTPKTNHYAPLELCLTPKSIRHNYDEYSSIPAHELVIRPLLENAPDALVYRGGNRQFFLCGKMQIPIDLKTETILISDKGRYRFDRTKECIRGHEYLWNAKCHKRGSIIIILPGSFDFTPILSHCYRPHFDETPNMGMTASAVENCKKAAAQGNIGICFSHTNQLEYMSVYAAENRLSALYKTALQLCQEVESIQH